MSMGFQIVGGTCNNWKYNAPMIHCAHEKKCYKCDGVFSAAIYNCFVVHRNRFWIKKNKSTQLWGMVCTYSLEYVLSKGPLALIKCATLLW